MIWCRVIDGAFHPGDIRAAAGAWPHPDWPHWFQYDSPLEKRRTCSDWNHIPFAVFHLLTQMLIRLPRGDCGPLIGDSSLHVGGMHDMGRGDFTAVHLDTDRHPAFGWERRFNSILFLEPWQSKWDGLLEIWEPNLKRRQEIIIPAENRLVVFETNGVSYWRVTGPMSCYGSTRRKSLAIYYWGPPLPGAAKRPQTRFVDLPGETPDFSREEMQKKSSRKEI